MNDCPNAEIRDQLPDLLHDRLDASGACRGARARRRLRRLPRRARAAARRCAAMLVARTPRVDVAYVVGALPDAAPRRRSADAVAARRAPGPTGASRRRSRVLIAGGGSLVVLNRSPAPIARAADRGRGVVGAPPRCRSPAQVAIGTVGRHRANRVQPARTVASVSAAATAELGGRRRPRRSRATRSFSALLDADRRSAGSSDRASRSPWRFRSSTGGAAPEAMHEPRSLDRCWCGIRLRRQRRCPSARRGAAPPARRSREPPRADAAPSAGARRRRAEQSARAAACGRRSAGVVAGSSKLNDEQMRQLERRRPTVSSSSGMQLLRSERQRVRRCALRWRHGERRTRRRSPATWTDLVATQQRRADLLGGEQQELGGFLTPLQRAKYHGAAEQLARVAAGDAAAGAAGAAAAAGGRLRARNAQSGVERRRR